MPSARGSKNFTFSFPTEGANSCVPSCRTAAVGIIIAVVILLLILALLHILKVYVYANLTSIGRTIIRQTAEQTRPMYARRADCLVRFCDFGWGGHRGISDIR